jgi:hypothetical protein
MKVTKIETDYRANSASLYIENLDRARVRMAASNPALLESRLTDAIGPYELSVGCGNDLILYKKATGHVCYWIQSGTQCIKVYNGHLSLAQKATELILGESLDDALKEFNKEHGIKPPPGFLRPLAASRRVPRQDNLWPF